MNRKTVNAAIDAAHRFIQMADVLLKDEGFDFDYMANKPTPYRTPPNAKSGAVRRASMNLTRDLAAMRKPS